MPLARLLQYQHCALRAHDVWTVPIGPAPTVQLDRLLAGWTPPMKANVKFDLRPIQRAIKALAPQVKKSRRELTGQAAKGFVKEVVAITPPAGKGQRGSAAKKAGEASIQHDLARVMIAARARQGVTLQDPRSIHQRFRDLRTGRINPRNLQKPYPVDAGALRALRNALLKRVGELAAGWNAGAQKLGVKLPAWVTRHGPRRSAVSVADSIRQFRITLTNAVKYVTNVADYDRRIQAALNLQAGKMQRKAEFLLTRALKRAGWK